MSGSEHDPPLAGRLELLTAAVVALVLALALGVTSLLMPTNTTETRKATYTQSGRFTYSADVPKDSVYGPTGLATGAPIITSVAHRVEFRFTYNLTSKAPTDGMHGNHTMIAQIDLGNGLKRDIPLTTKRHFRGTTFTTTGTLETRQLDTLSKLAQKVDPSFSDQLTVAIIPDVMVTGHIADQHSSAAFHPKLIFEFDGKILTLHQDTASNSGSEGSSGPLKPTTSGTVSYRQVVDNTIPLVVLHPTVTQGRIAGFGAALVVLGWALWLARPLLGRREAEDSPDRIQMLYGSRLVHVDSLSVTDGPVADVTSIAALAELAKRYESVIMHLDGGEDSYVVWDNGFLYRYKPSSHSPLEHLAPGPSDDSESA